MLSVFIASYETPYKIVVQVFVTLLRAHQSESRVLVRQALDILAPCLPERLRDNNEEQQHGSPTWVRWTRKIFVEDGHILAQNIGMKFRSLIILTLVSTLATDYTTSVVIL